MSIVLDENLKEVMYCEYCNKCKYKNKKQFEEPCDECLEEPFREGTKEPLKFVEE